MQIDEITYKITPTLIKHHIKRAGIFGSVAMGHTRKGSDIDLLVEFGTQISLLEFVGIKFELEEILGMSDRIMVMCEGRSAGTLDIADATDEKIMALATGVAASSVSAKTDTSQPASNIT